METFTAVGLLISALYAFQNLLRYLRAQDWNGTFGILVAAASGIGVVLLAAHSDVTAQLHLMQTAAGEAGPSLGNLDGGSQVLLGIAIGSGGTVLTDLRKAFDSSTTSEKPKLLPVASKERAAA